MIIVRAVSLPTMQPDIIITIDGPAGAGKSTTARQVAERLGYTYIDTGAMYRAATLAALRAGIALEAQPLAALVGTLTIELVPGPSGQRTLLNGEDVTEAIRKPEVTSAVSAVSAIPEVRKSMVARQRQIGMQGGVVMDGRDIGSVVFPHAQVKVYLVANIGERARRRLQDLQAQGEATTLDDQIQQIEHRDRLDSERAASPLVKPDGAVEIDTTDLSIEEQVGKILHLVKNYQKAYAYISAFGNL